MNGTPGERPGRHRVFFALWPDDATRAAISRATREAVRLSGGIPVVAIGGITLETAPDVIAAGASGVAVIADLLAGGRPRERIAAFLRALAL